MQAFLVILTLAAIALLAASPKRFRPTRSRSAVNTFIAVWGSAAVGAILGPTVSGVIPAEPINFAKPMAILGLGWIGVMVGSQARRGLLSLVPKRIWTIVATDIIISGTIFALISFAALTIWIGTGSHALAAIIAAASLGWAMETRSARVASTPEAHRLAIAVRASGGLLAMAAIVAVGITSIVVSNNAAPSKAIATTTLAVVAITAALLLKFAISISSGRRGDQLAVFLGAVGLAAGTAAEIGLSPLFAALLTGVAIANLPGKGLRSFEAFILRGEHVVAALFGLVAGILIDIRIGTAGLAFALILTAARLLLKPITLSAAIRLSPQDPAGGTGSGGSGGGGGGAGDLPESSPLYLAPIRVSPVAIALGVSLVILDPSPINQRVLTVILLSGLLAELVSMSLTLLGARRIHAIAASAAS